MAEGEFVLARQHLELSLSLVGFPTEWGSMGSDLDLNAMLCDAAGAEHDVSALRQVAQRTEELAAECGHRLYMGIAQRAWGIAYRLGGDLTEAEARLKRAEQLFQQLGTRWQLGRTYVELGEVAHTAGDVAAAHQHFNAAIHLFEQLRASPDVARANAALELLPV